MKITFKDVFFYLAKSKTSGVDLLVCFVGAPLPWLYIICHRSGRTMSYRVLYKHLFCSGGLNLILLKSNWWSINDVFIFGEEGVRGFVTTLNKP